VCPLGAISENFRNHPTDPSANTMSLITNTVLSALARLQTYWFISVEYFILVVILDAPSIGEPRTFFSKRSMGL
jgi:hypothetical protein